MILQQVLDLSTVPNYVVASIEHRTSYVGSHCRLYVTIMLLRRVSLLHGVLHRLFWFVGAFCEHHDHY